MMKSVLRLTVVMTLSLSVLVSCSPKTNGQVGWLQKISDEIGIFSNRTQTSDQFIAILKLSTPPLLASVGYENGQPKVDPQQLKAVLAEQEQVLKDLQQMSPNIQVIYRYKMVLNGFAIVGPNSLLEKLRTMGSISYLENSGNFTRPQLKEGTSGEIAEDILAANSVKWIGAQQLHDQQKTGKGIKVGIIDTGIDYTHAMLGGPGTEESYKSVDPSKETLLFPNKKVVGGIDLVGTKYDSASGDFSRHIPVPDSNPLDEAGHGSHVAGTVAGLGDGVNTYSGVAPDADLYAIKVFGAEGSTGDSVVVAALEYAADPTGKGTAEGRMDVVNLSLGSPWGSGHILYSEAVKNLTTGGTVVVASAGNEGPTDYIVGAPSVVDEALSVAASVDNATHNWQFGAVKFKTAGHGELLAEAIEGSISKPISEAGPISGKLVAAGFADSDLSQELKDKLKGNVAFIIRGRVPFSEKVKRALDAGALGVVMVQNQPGAAFQMGGEGKFEIPAVMISQALGDTLIEEMKSNDVVIEFQTSSKIQKPELIDTLTSFSSKGPRSLDSLIKPEISAPGANVISAAMGKGKLGVQMSGTSMAGPHVAGAMALMKEAFPKLSVQELKSMVMGRAVSIADEKKKNYPVSQQGAGRIQIDRAVESPLVADKVGLSLGELNIESKKVIAQKVELKNISKTNLTLKVEFKAGSDLITMSGPDQVSIAAGEKVTLHLNFLLDATHQTELAREFDGLVRVLLGGEEVFRIPVLGFAHKISQIAASDLLVRSTSAADAAGSAVALTLKNAGKNSGEALVFNLLGVDERKPNGKNDGFMNLACDLQMAGYRLIEKTIDGKKIPVLQVAAKLYQPLTSWNNCEVSVLIDANGDGVADQEFAGVALGNVKGLAGAGEDNTFMSVLLDAGKARSLRRDFEVDSKKEKDPKHEVKEDYSGALIDREAMTVFNHSTVAVIEADLSLLARSVTGELAIKVATIHNDSSVVQMDDYLGTGEREWKKISIDGQSQAFQEIPESITLAAGEEKTIDLAKGEGQEPLLVLMPLNRTVFSDLLQDSQAQILKPKYKVP